MREERPGTADLLPRLSAFAHLLHDAGLEAGPRRLTDATRALNHIELAREADFRSALRAVFVSRNQSFDRLCYPGEIQLRRQVVLV